MKIALAGGLLAGKTTLAMILEGLHDYHRVNFTDLLKQIASDTLKPYKPEVTVEYIHAHKADYRAYLQELSTLLKFTTEPAQWIDKVLPPDDVENVVFDNVRSFKQWQYLESKGFKLVALELTDRERRTRAEHNGMNMSQLAATMHHDTETWMLDYNVEPWKVIQSARHSPEKIAKSLVTGKDLKDTRSSRQSSRQSTRNSSAGTMTFTVAQDELARVARAISPTAMIQSSHAEEVRRYYATPIEPNPYANAEWTEPASPRFQAYAQAYLNGEDVPQYLTPPAAVDNNRTPLPIRGRGSNGIEVMLAPNATDQQYDHALASIARRGAGREIEVTFSSGRRYVTADHGVNWYQRT